MRMHPSKRIIGEFSERLSGKKILLGVTSSAAIYRSLDLARSLMRHGAEIYVIMTPKASKLISPQLFEWATGNEVLVELSGKIEHISLSEKVDLMVIAPATANTIIKLAYGIADNALLTTALAMIGMKKPVIIVPAMHGSLWNSPQLKFALNRLLENDVIILKPQIVEEKAKIPPNEEILEYVFKLFTRQTLKKKQILITAGSTRIYIDSIRFISNPSSGKMGVAMALEAFARGGNVTLLLAKHSTHKYYIPREINVQFFETYNELLQLVEKYSGKADIIVHTAAVGDFQPEKKYSGKLKSGTTLTLKLIPTKKIIKVIRDTNPDANVIAFKAEWNVSQTELKQIAIDFLNKYNLTAVVANDVSKGIFGADTTKALLVIRKNGEIKVYPLEGDKRDVSGKIWNLIYS